MVPKHGNLSKALDVFQRWSLRRTLRAPFLAHITNSNIDQRAGQVPVSDLISRWSKTGDFSYSAMHDVRCGGGQDHAKALKKTLREAWRGPWASPSNLAERDRGRHTLSELSARHGLEKSAEQRPLALRHGNGYVSQRAHHWWCSVVLVTYKSK